MLFNSLEFVFVFLPLTLAGYYLLIRLKLGNWVFLFLVLASLIFYAVWNPPYVILLVLSVLANFAVGSWLDRRRSAGKSLGLLLALGITGNAALLFYYKYTNFFLENLNAVAATDFHLQKIILPLAISFYTLQQIAFLVDVARGEVRTSGVWRYATFVIFFPQLIAGPIVHYRDMMPQFFGRRLGRFATANLTVGLTIFAIGLFKKAVIADSAAGFSTPVFDMAAADQPIGLLDAWRAAACYTFQLYFDFSGYSDMAVGLARMFGVKLAPNFHSPLRATSIIDYWRRWHMTLQQFILAYLYQPIVVPLARWSAGKRLNKWPDFWVTVITPTILVFLISGVWHGAAWTFVVWGLMHGIYVSINEYWRSSKRKARRKNPVGPGDIMLYRLLTIAALMPANVIFRAESLEDAVDIWAGMVRFDQILDLWTVLPANTAELVSEPLAFGIIAFCLIAFFPNTNQIMGRYEPVLTWKKWRTVGPALVTLQWRPNLKWALFTGVVLFLGVAFISRQQTEFIYFNF